MESPRSELRDGMRIDWDVPIRMEDGLVRRADVFRPERDGRYPVILSYGPYAKGLAFQDGYPSAWQRMVAEHPDVAHGSRNRYPDRGGTDPGARGLAEAAAPRRVVRLGRRRRLVSRHDAPRQNSCDLLGQLVRHAGED